MQRPDYDLIRQRLEVAWVESERLALAKSGFALPPGVVADSSRIFESNTQAYREVLLGCLLAKLEDPSADVRKPYIGLGDDAFNGRTLDERVVNPFLHSKRVPSSRGPYLSTFRRSVAFVAATRAGVRDKEGFDALLNLIGYVEACPPEEREHFLIYLLVRFVELRESSNIPLSRLHRISLPQYEELITGLLAVPSGGRIPVMLIIATFTAIKESFSLDWTIEFQGINESDSASGAGGDLTIRKSGRILLSAEITERPVEKSRVVATFNMKISPAGIEDYVFFVKTPTEMEEASLQARRYFAQGSEVNFVDMKTWILTSLVTIGKDGRSRFNAYLTDQFGGDGVPRSLKVAWNETIGKLTAS